MEAHDILLDEDGDLLEKDGDLVAGPSDAVHIEHILVSEKGTWKAEPMVGVGIAKYQVAPVTVVGKLKKEVRIQLEFDGYNIEAIQIPDLNNIVINAERL